MKQENVKNLLYKFRFYQFLSCAQKRGISKLKYGDPRYKKLWNEFLAIFSINPVYINYQSTTGKICQYKKLFKKVKINFDSSNIFLYWLDERKILFQKDTIIENMPVDYSKIVTHSLNDLEKQNQDCQGKIARQNLSLLFIFREYMYKVKTAILLSDLNEDRKEKHLSQIEKMEIEPATDLIDALQRILFWNHLLWQTGHSLVGLGRLDKILAEYPVNADTYTIIVEFLKILHEHYAFKSSAMRGDTGQIIVLGGLEENGEYFYNEYTSLIMQAIGELALPDPKILLRISKKMPMKLLYQATQCLKQKCGSPLLSNDDRIIPALEKFGYSHPDACNYGVSACWEPLVIGKSLEQNNLTNIEFASAFEDMLNKDKYEKCRTFEELLNLYFVSLDEKIEKCFLYLDKIKWEPDPLITFFTEGCILKEKDISEGGARYNNYGLLSVGLASTVNSLLNIKLYVFDKPILSLSKIKKILFQNYIGYEKYKDLFSKTDLFFGKDDKQVIDLTCQITDFVKKKVSTYKNSYGGKAKYGLSSPAYVVLGKYIGATADGREKGKPFSTHISATHGIAPTELIHFASCIDYNGESANGNVIDIIMRPDVLVKEADKFIDFLRGSLKIGFFQMQFNFISYHELVDAKDHPEKYPDLIVRVWGFSAYFNDLPEAYKDVLINRAKESENI